MITQCFFRLFLIFCILINWPAKTICQPDKNLSVAITDFDNKGLPINYAWFGSSFADAIINVLSNTSSIRIVERKYIKTILEELSIQMSGGINENTAVTVGNLIGANVFIFGSVSMLEENIITRARAISVERGEVIAAEEVFGMKEDLITMQNNLAKKFVSSLHIGFETTNQSNHIKTNIKLKTLSNLNRVKNLIDDFPIIGFDPARNRKKSEFYFVLTLCENILNEVPNLPEALLYKGMIATQLEDFFSAEQDLKICANMVTNYKECDLAISNLYFVQKRYLKTIEQLKKIIEKYPQDSRGWFALGKTYISRGNHSAAIEALITACEKTPFISEAENNLMSILNENNLYQIKNEQKPDIFLAAKIYLGYWNKNYKNIFDDLEICHSFFPNLYIVHYLDGIKSKINKNFHEAILHFKNCISIRPDFPEVHRDLGFLFLRTGMAKLGKQHINIYLKTADFIEDYDEIKKTLKKFRN